MTGSGAPPLDATLAILSAHGHDLREYLRGGLAKRLDEYLGGAPGGEPAAYLARLEADPGERARVVDALLVSSSQFFRHVELFHALRDGGVARLARDGALRVWVAGAATGEEAWSVAMVLAEAEARGGPSWEVIASDLNEAALAVARVGRYSRAAAARIPADLRAEYTVADGDTVAIADSLRGRVVFARHDLLGPSLAPAEAVLARFELVLCCNVLIYLEHHLQVRVLERLLRTLAPGAALALGVHERPAPELAGRLRRFPGLSQPVPLFGSVEGDAP